MELIESVNSIQPQPLMLLGQEAGFNYPGAIEPSGKDALNSVKLFSDELNLLTPLAASQLPPEELILPTQQETTPEVVLTASTAEAVFDTTINFSDFSNITGLTLNGNATQAGSSLRLTPALANQKGSAFLTTPFTIADDTSFQTHFQFRLQGVIVPKEPMDLPLCSNLVTVALML